VDQIIVSRLAGRFGVPDTALKPLSGGHFSQVYEFSRDGRPFVLRLIPPNPDIDVASLLSISHWMDYLSAHEAAVSKPVRSTSGDLVEAIEHDGALYLAVAQEKAQGTLGEELPFDRWNDALYQTLGKELGRIHALARDYTPPHGVTPRPHWNEETNCFNPSEVLDSSQVRLIERQTQIAACIQGLPKDREGYGLAHLDLHFANLFVDDVAQVITFFDFDDCAYGWYVMDLAMLLLDTLVLYPCSDREDFAARFFQNVLKSYASQSPLSRYWINQIPHFLALLEIGLYTQLYRDYDPTDRSSWVGRFMQDRKARIEAGVPYVNIEFDTFEHQ